MTRPLSVIARAISSDWSNPYFGAIPYINAMAQLSSIKDDYYQDRAASVVRYFLANANSWRGETARAVKLELKTMLKGV